MSNLYVLPTMPDVPAPSAEYVNVRDKTIERVNDSSTRP